jgi:type I restriction enzyme S subunit
MSDMFAPLSVLVTRVQGGGTPSRAVSMYWHGLIPWASVKDMTKQTFEMHDTVEHISPKGLSSSSACLIPAGIPIVATRMAVGKTVIPTVDVAINQDLKALYPASDVDSRYLAHILQFIEPRVDAVSVGSTVRGISVDQLMRFRVFSPPLSEQRRIAEILDTLDDQIRATEQIIVKLKAMKKGLLEGLLAKGVPGSVLGDGLAGSPANGIYKPASMIGRGELLVGQTAFTEDRLVDPLLARKAVVSGVELNRFGIINGDILVSRVFATLSGVGQPAYVESLTRPATFESNMMRLRANPNRADAFFLFQLLQTSGARSHITRNANLSNQASISQKVLTSMPVFLPPLPEQERIAEILNTADLRRYAHRRELEKLRLAKKAVMADLLTGRVRVPTGAGS